MTEKVDLHPCPYKSLPATSYWRRAVSNVPAADIDPVLSPKFSISETDRVATAGSCFAQHIARYMKRSGFNYFVTEPGHALLNEALLGKFNFGTFSARYGNIYTTRQLLQLLERAYGLRHPIDDMWEAQDGIIDPFRPFIQPGGFTCREEFQADREQHFAAVRRIVEEADVFVFTLGLTEAWENAADGAVYAICPGCGAGTHDPSIHRFHNFDVSEVTDDLQAAIEFITKQNPAIRILLTVSPVPLIATFEPQHVLASTTYSKSVLRVAAQAATNQYDHVDYFPSYEIITSSFSRGAYFAEDLRDVEETGVSHAMRCFFRNYLQGVPEGLGEPDQIQSQSSSATTASERINDLVCDEERLVD